MRAPRLVMALLAGCTAGDPDGSRDAPRGLPPLGAGIPTTPPDDTDTGVEAPADRLELGEVVTCADPASRQEHRFDTEWLDVTHTGPRDLEGGGMVVADLDGDGLLDLLAAGSPPKLFRGTDGGRAFAEDPSGLEGLDLERMVGGSAADYDADGDLDVFVTRWERTDVLLRNDDGVLVDVTDEARIGGPGVGAVSGAWDDFDGDGDLDLAVGRYGPHPDLSLDPMPPGNAASLFRNAGDGTFDDVSGLLPAEVRDAYVFMTGWYDLDIDGDRELFSVHDFGYVRSSRLLRNDAGTLVLDDSAGFHPDFEGMGLGVGDVNRDGVPDFLQTSNRRISLLLSFPTAGSATGVVYVESAASLGLAIEPGTASYKGHDWGWGAAIGDVDSDGDLDAAAAFGAWDTWFGNPIERDALWEFDAGTFDEVATHPEWDLDWSASTRGLLLVDLDGDGYLDLLRNALDAPFRVDRARCGPHAWLEVALDDGRTPGNRAGLGARVEVEADGALRTAWLESGSTSLFTGGPAVAHLGLGDAQTITSLCVTWPDHARDCFQDLEPRRRVVVRR